MAPDHKAGHHELPCSLAFGLVPDPSTTWVSPSNRLVVHNYHLLTLGQLRKNVANGESVKTEQVHFNATDYRSHENGCDDFSRNICQAEIASLSAKGQPFMIDS